MHQMIEMHGYKEIMAQRAEIMKQSVGIDYSQYETGAIAFDYERLMADTGYDVHAARVIQSDTAVGNTPLIELKNITELVRAVAKPGKGARIFVKDEAANPSGSFKDRRASLSVHEAKKKNYSGVVAATSVLLFRKRSIVRVLHNPKLPKRRVPVKHTVRK
jgi:hypothetical protein